MASFIQDPSISPEGPPEWLPMQPAYGEDVTEPVLGESEDPFVGVSAPGETSGAELEIPNTGQEPIYTPGFVQTGAVPFQPMPPPPVPGMPPMPRVPQEWDKMEGFAGWDAMENEESSIMSSGVRMTLPYLSQIDVTQPTKITEFDKGKTKRPPRTRYTHPIDDQAVRTAAQAKVEYKEALLDEYKSNQKIIHTYEHYESMYLYSRGMATWGDTSGIYGVEMEHWGDQMDSLKKAYDQARLRNSEIKRGVYRQAFWYAISRTFPLSKRSKEMQEMLKEYSKGGLADFRKKLERLILKWVVASTSGEDSDKRSFAKKVLDIASKKYKELWDGIIACTEFPSPYFQG